jgi:hypothetical protein
MDQVKHWWQSCQFDGNPSYVLARKLKTLKGDLRRWNKEVFGHVGKRKKALLEEIRELDSYVEVWGLEEEKRKKELLSMELERLLLCEEISWHQKSRALWLKEGDERTQNSFIGWQTLTEEIILLNPLRSRALYPLIL